MTEGLLDYGDEKMAAIRADLAKFERSATNQKAHEVFLSFFGRRIYGLGPLCIEVNKRNAWIYLGNRATMAGPNIDLAPVIAALTLNLWMDLSYYTTLAKLEDVKRALQHLGVTRFLGNPDAGLRFVSRCEGLESSVRIDDFGTTLVTCYPLTDAEFNRYLSMRKAEAWKYWLNIENMPEFSCSKLD